MSSSSATICASILRCWDGGALGYVELPRHRSLFFATSIRRPAKAPPPDHRERRSFAQPRLREPRAHRRGVAHPLDGSRGACGVARGAYVRKRPSLTRTREGWPLSRPVAERLTMGLISSEVERARGRRARRTSLIRSRSPDPPGLKAFDRARPCEAALRQRRLALRHPRSPLGCRAVTRSTAFIPRSQRSGELVALPTPCLAHAPSAIAGPLTFRQCSPCARSPPARGRCSGPRALSPRLASRSSPRDAPNSERTPSRSLRRHRPPHATISRRRSASIATRRIESLFPKAASSLSPACSSSFVAMY